MRRSSLAVPLSRITFISPSAQYYQRHFFARWYPKLCHVFTSGVWFVAKVGGAEDVYFCLPSSVAGHRASARRAGGRLSGRGGTRWIRGARMRDLCGDVSRCLLGADRIQVQIIAFVFVFKLDVCYLYNATTSHAQLSEKRTPFVTCIYSFRKWAQSSSGNIKTLILGLLFNMLSEIFIPSLYL